MRASESYALIRIGVDGRRGVVGSYRRRESAERARSALLRSAAPGVEYDVVAVDAGGSEAEEHKALVVD